MKRRLISSDEATPAGKQPIRPCSAMKSRTKKKRRAWEARETRLDYVYHQSSHRWIYMAQLGFTIRLCKPNIRRPDWNRIHLQQDHYIYVSW